ncbi:MAG: Crp/Fnr family transcriptional regulator [Saprospiraceae bacterium]|nr:Crp/Fnr family transcriptional regulator [Saprospiraceae bacterium]
MSINNEETRKRIRLNFPGLADQQLLTELEEKAKIEKVQSAEIIIDYGDKIKFLPLVLEGSLKVSRLNENDHEVFLYYLTPGDTCAASFSCCLVQKRSEIMAVAEEDSTLLLIPLEAADEWMGKYADWRNFIFSMYDYRLFSLIDTVDRLAFSKLDEQLVDYLEKTAFALNSKTLETTHQKIALDLNASREAISRLLKKLEKNGKVKLERNKIHLTM